jgi:hypothetical protein
MRLGFPLTADPFLWTCLLLQAAVAHQVLLLTLHHAAAVAQAATKS